MYDKKRRTYVYITLFKDGVEQPVGRINRGPADVGTDSTFLGS